MSDAFQCAWAIVKDFYFAPDSERKGAFHPEQSPPPRADYDVSPFASDQLEMGKDLKTIHEFDENYTYPFPTPTEAFQRGSSRLRRFNTPTGTVGVNLGRIGSMDMRNGYDENRIIDLITEILSHEYGHSTIHDFPLSGDENENVAHFIGDQA